MAHSIPDYFYHGTATHYLSQINASGLPASLSGFGQTGLSGVGLTTDITAAEGYARSTAKATNSKPVILVVEVPQSYWVDLRSNKLPMDIYNLEAANEGFDPDNIQEFRNWFQQFQKDEHPMPLTQILMNYQFDGAIIPSTVKIGASPEYVYFYPQFVYIVDETYP